MNYVLRYLSAHHHRLGLANLGVRGPLVSVLVTPRFRASSAVVFLVLQRGKSQPVLVAKVPRLEGRQPHLEREAANLNAVHQLRAGGFDAIPRLVAFEEHQGRPILLETALLGQPMDPPRIRKAFEHCYSASTRVLAELHGSGQTTPDSLDAFERWVPPTFAFLSEAIPWDREEQVCLARSRDFIQPLKDARLPTVFEHGDFSHPNLMLMANNEVGIVDWELAEPHGLPGYDLIFFLTYAAFARQRARENRQHLQAIQNAFFGRNAWATRKLSDFAEQVAIPQQALPPLFLFSWLRYLASLLHRLHEAGEEFSRDTADWVRQNRYYQAWRSSVEHFHELRWQDRRP